jgi:hypothetical protein
MMELIDLSDELMLQILRYIVVFKHPIEICYSVCFDRSIVDVGSTLRICWHLHNLAIPLLYAQNEFKFRYQQYDSLLFFSALSDTAYSSITQISTDFIFEHVWKNELYFLSGCSSLRILNIHCGGSKVPESCLKIIRGFRLRQLNLTEPAPCQEDLLKTLTTLICNPTERSVCLDPFVKETRQQKVVPPL